MYTAPPIWLPSSPHITPWSLESLGLQLKSPGETIPGANIAWPSSNRTIYVPVWPQQNILIKRMFSLNGSTVGTDTITVAIYASDSSHLPSTRLVTANATAAGASALQFFDITDTNLTAGQLYYMSMAVSGTTATFFRTTVTTLFSVNYFFTQNSNTPTPTATPALAATGFLPVFGLDLRGAP